MSSLSSSSSSSSLSHSLLANKDSSSSAPLPSSFPYQPETMAINIPVSAGTSQSNYKGRLTSFVLLSCMVAGMGGVIFGYDLGVSGGVTSMESFLKEFFPEVYERSKGKTNVSNYCVYDSHILTAFTSSLYIAGLFSSIIASSVTRAYGRKPSIIVGGGAFLAGGCLSGVAINVYMLISGRLLLGLGLGFANQAIPVYLSEMAPPQHRGAINYGFQFSQGVGFILSNVINYGTEQIPGGWGWRISLALAVLPASLLLVGCVFLPETPNSLVQRGAGLPQAIDILQKIRGTTDIQAELNDLLIASSSASSAATSHPLRETFKRKHRPHLTMAIALPTFQQFTGFSLIAFYSPVLLRTIGFGESASLLSAVAIGVVGTGCNFFSMAAIDKLGRRPLFLAGGACMFVPLVAIGGIMAAELKDHGEMSKGYAYVVLFLVLVYVASFQWSWGPLAWLVPSEIFPLEIRSAAQSVTVGVGFLGTFAVAQTFLSMLCNMKYAIFFFFAGWMGTMTLFVYLLLPETKNLPIEQMDKVWKEHWFWSKLVAEQGRDG